MARVDELNELLAKLNDAAVELRGTISDAHTVRTDIRNELRSHRADIERIITRETRDMMDTLRETIKADMEELVTDEIDRIVAEWRRALRLDP